jgi:hypothetical protein
VALRPADRRTDATVPAAGSRRTAPSDAGIATSAPRGVDRRTETDLALARGLDGYVRAVADALEVGIEATDSEVSDTATAYLGLAVRSPAHPDRDLMLVWTERHGWALAVETAPTEPPAVLSYLGADVVPEPRDVARFVTDVLAGSRPVGLNAPDVASGRHDVGSRLARYITAWG